MMSKELFKKWKEWIVLECPCDRNDVDELEQIERDLEALETINSKRFLLFSERKKLAKEYEDWCIKNNALITDSTNMVTWFLCIKLKEWLKDEK